jgi:hypothetical protein
MLKTAFNSGNVATVLLVPDTFSDPALIELASPHDSSDPAANCTAAEAAETLLPTPHVIDSLARTVIPELACTTTLAPSTTVFAVILRLAVVAAAVTVQPRCTVSSAASCSSGQSTLLRPLKEMLPPDRRASLEATPLPHSKPDPTPETSMEDWACREAAATLADPLIEMEVAKNGDDTPSALRNVSDETG